MNNNRNAALKAWATRRAKAQAVSPVSRLNALLKQQTKWQRREKIARGKLERIRRQLDRLLDEVTRVPKNLPDEVNDYARRKLVLK